MKQTLLATVALASIASAPAWADGGASPWYVGATVGAGWADGTAPLTSFGDILDTSFDSGWAVTAAAGYRWTPNTRVELEFGYRSNDVDSIFETPNGVTAIQHTSVSGQAEQFSVMANAAYDFAVANNVGLSLGGGIGIADVEFDASGSGQELVRDANNDWTFAYQLIAGVTYKVSDRVDLVAEYRYFKTDSVDVITYPPPNSPLVDSIDPSSHAVTVGVRYGLGG